MNKYQVYLVLEHGKGVEKARLVNMKDPLSAGLSQVTWNMKGPSQAGWDFMRALQTRKAPWPPVTHTDRSGCPISGRPSARKQTFLKAPA